MPDGLYLAPRPDNKRKFDDQSAAAPTPFEGRTAAFSRPVASYSTESTTPFPPPPGGIQPAKQSARQIASRLFTDAEAMRPRFPNGALSDDANKGFASAATAADYFPKPLGKQMISSHVGFATAMSFTSYGFQGSSKKIDIPNQRVGVIIGKGGDTIKYLQLQSGAKIQVTRDIDADPNSQTRMVELMGTSEQISKAEQLINDMLAEAESGGSSTVATRRFSGLQPGTEQYQMNVPNNMVGPVIGKGGGTITNMQARSGACIQDQGADSIEECNQGNQSNENFGTVPPWLEANENCEPSPVICKKSHMNNASSSNRTGKSQKLNPKRVGAAWAEKRRAELEMERRGEIISTYDPNWLPNFGRVWQTGTRKESRKEFEIEKQKSVSIDSQGDRPLEIQPYVSKRMRLDSGGNTVNGHVAL